jgi:ribosome-interacting GTPase 1
MKQEKRVTEIMNSLEGVQKAKAPHDGFAKIQQKLADQRKQLPPIKQQVGYGWMKIAAVIALVIISNIWAVSNFMSSNINSEISGNYTQIITDFNLYENE